MAVGASERIGGVAIELGVGIAWGLAFTMELEGTFCEGCRRGFGSPSYTVGKI
jgi:hypothetical protein